MKQRYDLLQEGQLLAIGDAVWLHDPQRRKGVNPKLQRPWKGPYLIKKNNDLIYRIWLGPHTKPKVYIRTNCGVQLDPIPHMAEHQWGIQRWWSLQHHHVPALWVIGHYPAQWNRIWRGLYSSSSQRSDCQRCPPDRYGLRAMLCWGRESLVNSSDFASAPHSSPTLWHHLILLTPALFHHTPHIDWSLVLYHNIHSHSYKRSPIPLYT